MTEEEKRALEMLRKNSIGRYKNGTDIIAVEDFKKILNLISKLQEENEKKDKVIDKMALYISGLDTDEDICKKMYSNNTCEDNEISCRECIEQYFYGKVENND